VKKKTGTTEELMGSGHAATTGYRVLVEPYCDNGESWGERARGMN